MKNVLLLVHDDDGQDARLQVALDVVRALDGHLICLDVEFPPVAGAYVGDSVALASLLADEHDRELANRSRLAVHLAREDVAWSWSDVVDLPAPSIEAAASFADIIVLSSRIDTYEPMSLRRLIGRVTGKVARPVLAVPNMCKRLAPSGPVLIAWDGSREADDALRDAVPLLNLSANVILLDLDEPRGVFAPGMAASYLSRHGVHAQVDIASRKAGGAIFTAILDKAHEMGASYIVMGAFGHALAVEAIFGGVTRSMLANSDVPLFLAH